MLRRQQITPHMTRPFTEKIVTCSRSIFQPSWLLPRQSKPNLTSKDKINSINFLYCFYKIHLKMDLKIILKKNKIMLNKKIYNSNLNHWNEQKMSSIIYLDKKLHFPLLYYSGKKYFFESEIFIKIT